MTTTSTPPTVSELEHDWRTWHAARERDLATEHGWLTLTAFSWLGDEPGAVADLPGRWSTHDGSAVLRAEASDGLTVSGELVDGVVTATVPEAGSLSWVRHGRRLVELVLRGGRYAVRLRDPEAPTRAQFQGVPSYPIEAGWVVSGRFVPFAEPQVIEVATARGDLRQVVTAVGTVTLELEGTAYELLATAAKDGALNLAFHDATNGIETAPWRAVTTSVPTESGAVTIDFNRAFNFPFAFTDFGTCPAPPTGNRLPAAVTAGEKSPR